MEAEHEVFSTTQNFADLKSLKRFLNYGQKFNFYLEEEENTLLEHLERKDFIYRVTYPDDIINHTNKINLQIQGLEVAIMDAIEKLQGFLAKLSIRKKTAEADILANFQMLEEVFTKMKVRDNILCQFI
jgi:hypothetical protein